MAFLEIFHKKVHVSVYMPVCIQAIIYLTMKNFYVVLLLPMIVLLVSCGNDDLPPYKPLKVPEYNIFDHKDDSLLSEIRQRHGDAPLKVLAIGNSFTNNATYFLPWFSKELNADSICFAKLVRSGCSLDMHWISHCNNTPDYEFYYSDGGNWVLTDVKKFDSAAVALDWDIIVMQQVSGLSGVYSSYQPALDYLVGMFREAYPDVRLVWHYTWAYKPGTDHPDFSLYDKDPRKMYEAILDAGDRASEIFDLSIPSASLMWRMREEFTEVEDGFSKDGYHISSGFACYAISSLWYECLVKPFSGTTSICPPRYPEGMDRNSMKRSEEIILSLTGNN